MSGEASDAEIQEFLARAGAREFCARTATNSRAGARPGRGCARERRSARPPQAEETLVRVVPSFQHDVLRFVTGNYGPFEPQEPCEVPLWLACLLRKRKMCTVEAPPWLRTEALEQTRDAETKDRDAFQALPAHYVEVAALLLECAGDDLAAACGAATVSKLRECLADVEAARVAKVREGMLAVARQACADETTFSVKMNGASAMEITTVRGRPRRLDAFYATRPPAAAAARAPRGGRRRGARARRARRRSSPRAGRSARTRRPRAQLARRARRLDPVEVGPAVADRRRLPGTRGSPGPRRARAYSTRAAVWTSEQTHCTVRWRV